MPSVAVLAADGFETIECLTMVDVMRRGGVRAIHISISHHDDLVITRLFDVEDRKSVV